jgi:signal transduction histidine kinase
MRENEAVLVHSAKEAGKIHLAKYEVAGSQPYVIVPIRRGGDGTPVGLLTAQRHEGLERQHGDFLQSGAEIVALLLENVRSREALERVYRKMIRNTRIETLGTVVPFITHNMKTPLVVVEGLAESIRKDFGNLDHAELEKRISGVKAQTDLCFQLIRSVSQYNKLGNSPTSFVGIRQGLERICGFFIGYFRIKNIDLVQRYQIESAPNIEMEELDFVQVITNLLINADDAFSEMRKSCDERMIRDHMRIEIALMSEAEKARIEIADNGPGIRGKDLPRVFEEHFTTKDFGTGVGLPYCRRVVEEAGGTIDILSRYGVGTTVSILLPIQ